MHARTHAGGRTDAHLHTPTSPSRARSLSRLFQRLSRVHQTRRPGDAVAEPVDVPGDGARAHRSEQQPRLAQGRAQGAQGARADRPHRRPGAAAAARSARARTHAYACTRAHAHAHV
eukprot:861256-Pleurochrysis_carterae.AAC.2